MAMLSGFTCEILRTRNRQALSATIDLGVKLTYVTTVIGTVGLGLCFGFSDAPIWRWPGYVNRVLELTPDGVHQYGGGYTEYVARTGHEAPGLHPGG